MMYKGVAELREADDHQAVILPEEFRFEGSAVGIRKEGKAVILEPLEKRTWPAGFWDAFWSDGPAGDDFTPPEPLPDAPHRDAVLRELDPDHD